LRWSELVRLVPDDIVGNRVLVRLSKTGRPREVPVSETFAEQLRSELPFRNSVSKPIDYATFRRWHWLPATAGMDIRFHDLRRTYASWLLDERVSLIKIRDLLGHASMVTTELYLLTVPNSQRDAKIEAAIERKLAN
jgi:integrase